MAQETIDFAYKFNSKYEGKWIRSEKEAIQFAPSIPLFYDRNYKFEEEINDFNG